MHDDGHALFLTGCEHRFTGHAPATHYSVKTQNYNFGQFLLEILHLMTGSPHTLYLQPIILEFGRDFAKNMPERS